jgi:diguanylate cyclase (GGDEF)-like protein
MPENVAILLAVLVAANVILILVALWRSRSRRRAAALEPSSSEVHAAAARASAGPRPAVAANAEPAAVSRHDPLTGVLMPAEWSRILLDEDARIHRYGRPATVVLIELDGFDRLVTALGDEAGDRVLPALADALRRHARGSDHVARLGRARFAVLLPETGEVEAVNYVERVRQICELWLESGSIALRQAIGWASPSSDSTLLDAFGEAQDRMYAELRRGARRASDATGPTNGAGPTNELEGAPSPA